MAQMTGENAGGAADQVEQGGYFHRCIGANFIYVSQSMFLKSARRDLKNALLQNRVSLRFSMKSSLSEIAAAGTRDNPVQLLR